MNWRNIFSLSAFAALALALAATNPGLAGEETDVSDAEWTVVAMDFDGSWGGNQHQSSDFYSVS